MLDDYRRPADAVHTPPMSEHYSYPVSASDNELPTKDEAKDEGATIITSDSVKDEVQPAEDEGEEASKATILTVFPTLLICMFLVALDRTIIGTAIPKITDEFDSIDDIAWYGSSYMLTNASTQLLFGRIYRFYNNKWVFLLAILLFEVGSAVCGAAPTSDALIVGRAIAGVGAAGIFSGSVLIITHLVPLHKRPMYAGAFGGVFAVSSVVGPVMGGAFADRLTWRWCFYINLPFAAVAIAIVWFFLKVREPEEKRAPTIAGQIKKLDPLGTLFLTSSMVCLILALQWGGAQYAWSSGRVIALLTVFAATFVAFIGIQIWKKDEGTLPPRVMKQRSIAAGFVFSFFGSAAMMILAYYIPLWFQAIKGVSPVKAGVMTLPFIIGLLLGTIFAGGFTQRVGFYTPAMILGSMFAAVGAGLLTTFTRTTGSPAWIGFQFLYGFGLGMGMQQTGLTAQTVLPKLDIPIGVALMFFAQQLGGAVFLAVGQNVFIAQLVKSLSKIPGLDMRVLDVGATDLRKLVPPQLLNQVLDGYNYSLTKMWFVTVGVICAQFLGALAMEWKSIKQDMPPAKKGKKLKWGKKGKKGTDDQKPEDEEKAVE